MLRLRKPVSVTFDLLINSSVNYFLLLMGTINRFVGYFIVIGIPFDFVYKGKRMSGCI